MFTEQELGAQPGWDTPAMQDRGRIIRAVLQVTLSIAVIVGAVTGSQVLLLVAVLLVLAVLMWEFEIRRRRRA